MASTFAVTRNHLIFGLCLPLAVLLGYMLADIDDPASRLVILAALGVLAVPVLMRWYHVLLILSWNSAVQPALPGYPKMWAVMALLGIFFAVLNRSVNREFRFAHVPSLTMPMLLFSCVIVVTALLNGGVGLRIFGASAVGGKGYVYILAAIAGFFALSSRAIPTQHANIYAALFFLPGLSSVFSRLASWVGPKANFVHVLFPPDTRVDEFIAGPVDAGTVRVAGLVGASLAIMSWLLARHGLKGVFDLSRPWRLACLLIAVSAGMLAGFRSVLLLVAAVLFILFTLERLWGTRLVVGISAALIVGGALLVGFADRLPLPMQRTFSFLPIKVDPVTKEMADFSTQWRVDMWKTLLPEVPKYLLMGKGYNYSSEELFMAQVQAMRVGAVAFEEAAVAGDYHNGPLSIVIPFGAAGLAGFIWLMFAGVRFLYTVYQESAPELRLINGFLFALFLARVLLFFFVFGSLYTELYHFTGILGFSVALNVAGRSHGNETDRVPVNEEVS